MINSGRLAFPTHGFCMVARFPLLRFQSSLKSRVKLRQGGLYTRCKYTGLLGFGHLYDTSTIGDLYIAAM